MGVIVVLSSLSHSPSLPSLSFTSTSHCLQWLTRRRTCINTSYNEDAQSCISTRPPRFYLCSVFRFAFSIPLHLLCLILSYRVLSLFSRRVCPSFHSSISTISLFSIIANCIPFLHPPPFHPAFSVCSFRICGRCIRDDLRQIRQQLPSINGKYTCKHLVVIVVTYTLLIAKRLEINRVDPPVANRPHNTTVSYYLSWHVQVCWGRKRARQRQTATVILCASGVRLRTCLARQGMTIIMMDDADALKDLSEEKEVHCWLRR